MNLSNSSHCRGKSHNHVLIHGLGVVISYNIFRKVEDGYTTVGEKMGEPCTFHAMSSLAI